MQKLMKAMHKNEKGFTLVELMVVVVIIGVLVAIAIPIFQNVTRGANRGAIEANLRTIDGIVMMYYADTNSYPTINSQIATAYLQVWPDGEPDTDVRYGLYQTAGGGPSRAVVFLVNPRTNTTDITGHDPDLNLIAEGTTNPAGHSLDQLPWRQ